MQLEHTRAHDGVGGRGIGGWADPIQDQDLVPGPSQVKGSGGTGHPCPYHHHIGPSRGPEETPARLVTHWPTFTETLVPLVRRS